MYGVTAPSAPRVALANKPIRTVTDDATDQVDADHVELVVPSRMKFIEIWPLSFRDATGSYSAG